MPFQKVQKLPTSEKTIILISLCHLAAQNDHFIDSAETKVLSSALHQFGLSSLDLETVKEMSQRQTPDFFSSQLQDLRESERLLLLNMVIKMIHIDKETNIIERKSLKTLMQNMGLTNYDLNELALRLKENSADKLELKNFSEKNQVLAIICLLETLAIDGQKTTAERQLLSDILKDFSLKSFSLDSRIHALTLIMDRLLTSTDPHNTPHSHFQALVRELIAGVESHQLKGAMVLLLNFLALKNPGFQPSPDSLEALRKVFDQTFEDLNELMDIMASLVITEKSLFGATISKHAPDGKSISPLFASILALKSGLSPHSPKERNLHGIISTSFSRIEFADLPKTSVLVLLELLARTAMLDGKIDDDEALLFSEIINRAQIQKNDVDLFKGSFLKTYGRPLQLPQILKY